MTISSLGGKVLLFQTSPPSLGIGRVKARDNPTAYGTDREPLLRRPDDEFYRWGDGSDPAARRFRRNRREINNCQILPKDHWVAVPRASIVGTYV
jgi:hypothetical protein